jgi:hypothetical protein
MTNDDIWSNDSDVISSEAVDTSDGGTEEGFVLDLSEDAELGTEYPVIPLKTYVHCRVYEATQKVSQKGNDMYALVLRATDDEWGKNRQLRFWITLSSSALAFTLPSLAALGVPAQFNGKPVATVKELRKAKDGLEIVYPPISIRAEPHVAVVDDNVDRKGTRAAAEAYLNFLYSDAGQEIIAGHYYRPSNDAILKKNAGTFPEIKLFQVTEIAKDFEDAHKQFIGEGGVFDAIYKPEG